MGISRLYYGLLLLAVVFINTAELKPLNITINVMINSDQKVLDKLDSPIGKLELPNGQLEKTYYYTIENEVKYGCETLPGFPDNGFVTIDKEKYIGKWWNVQRPGPSDWTCVSYTYGATSFANKLTLRDERIVRGEPEMGFNTMVLTESPGGLGTQVRYGNKEPAYYVLATDYTTYSIEYEVKEGHTKIWVYSRTQVMPQDTRDLIKKILLRSKLHIFPLYEVDMSTCYDSEEAEENDGE